MGALSHSVTYQGYPASAFEFRWDAGLEPSSGWVDLNLADVQQILINVKTLPWGGNAFPGMSSILVTASTRNTIAEAPGGPVRQGPGFSNFGDLVLKSFNGSNAWHTPITYNRIFIAESGIEEIQRDLARVRMHDEGKIRVQLTDVRMFYKNHGALLQRFNCRRPGGEFDQITMKKTGSGSAAVAPTGGGGAGSAAETTSSSGQSFATQTAPTGGSPGSDDSYEPWTFVDIIKYLFRLLPGSPEVHSGSDLLRSANEIPTDIIGEGEPVAQWISKLLQQYGYEAHLMPDSSTFMVMKLGKKAPYGQVPTAPEQWENIDDCHYERKTIWIKNRPPAVTVIGKRRVRRMSTFYIPIFQSSDDGMFYKLSAVDSVYGYSIGKLNKQVMVGHEKNFRDVPPIGTVKGSLRGASLRRCAYKMYAPAGAFPDGKNRATLQDLQRQPFMPMKKCPVYLDELRAWMGMTEDPEEQQQGDKGPFALVAPIVRAYRYGQGHFKDFGKMKEHFDATLSMVDRELNWANQMQQWIDLRMSKPGTMRPQEDLLSNIAALSKYFSKLSAQSINENFDAELVRRAVAQELISKKEAAKIMDDAVIDMFKKPNQHEIENAKQSVNKARAWRSAVQREFGKYQKAFGNGTPPVLARCQQTWGMVPRGSYSINTQTGVVMFGEPAVRCLQPFLLDNDSGEVYADGDVTVTFGHELDSNSPMDYTSVSFVPDDKGEPNQEAEPICVSLCYPVAMPSHVEHASNMQLYEDQTGTPFNKAACITEASSYAHGAIKMPQRVEGYTYELDGLRKVVLEGGVSSVRHELREDGLAYTQVMVNAPNARGIIPGKRPNAWVQSIHDRRMIETSKGNEDQ